MIQLILQLYRQELPLLVSGQELFLQEPEEVLMEEV
jgi:hypothetical protein